MNCCNAESVLARSPAIEPHAPRRCPAAVPPQDVTVENSGIIVVSCLSCQEQLREQEQLRYNSIQSKKFVAAKRKQGQPKMVAAAGPAENEVHFEK